MKKTILAIILMASAFGAVANPSHVAGDVLDYYAPERPAVQVGANIIDLTGQPMTVVAQELAKYERLTASAEVLAIAKVAAANNAKVAPKYHAMMVEQAKIRGQEVHELYASAAQMDWSINEHMKEALGLNSASAFQLAAEEMRGCTTAAFDTGIVGQTNDLNIDQLLNFPTNVIKTDDTIFIPTDGSHFQGMGKHVGAVLNFMGEASGPGATGDTKNVVTIDAAFAAITSSESVEDAYNKLKGYTTPVATNFTVADSNGDHGGIEMSANGVRLVRGEGGTAHGNHTAETKAAMLSDMTKQEANATFTNTFAREEFVENFLSYSIQKDVDGMKYLFNQAPVNIAKKGESDFVTVEAMIFDLKAGCAYVSGDNPLFGEYSQVCFD